jgi:hypothetical protein
MTISIKTLSIRTELKDCQHLNTWHSYTQRNDTPLKDNQNNNKVIQHKYLQHNTNERKDILH